MSDSIVQLSNNTLNMQVGRWATVTFVSDAGSLDVKPLGAVTPGISFKLKEIVGKRSPNLVGKYHCNSPLVFAYGLAVTALSKSHLI